MTNLTTLEIVGSSMNSISNWDSTIGSYYGGGPLHNLVYSRSLRYITLPNSCKSIGESAFDGCSKLVSINMPNVSSIGNYAFKDCPELISINIPSVSSIGNNAFSSCTSLTTITIPNSVISIGDSAFSSCTSLTTITIPVSKIDLLDNAYIPNWKTGACTSVTENGITIFSRTI
jgi:hypothetical protein